MNTLDELFGEALDREALSTTHERRAAVAEVTIHGARRQRGVRGTVRVLGLAAVVGVAAFVGSLVFAHGDVAPTHPTSTPTQPAPNVTTEPDLDYASVTDDRFPQAPQMTADDWDAVTLAWDAELVSFVGGGKDVYGSVTAIYLTPPGGTRMLAWATNTVDLGFPTLLSFDATTRSVMLNDTANSDAVRTLNLVTGVLGEAPLNLAEPISGYVPLGKISNGDSIFLVNTVSSKAEYTQHVFRTFDNTAVPVIEGQFALSTLWNDRFVVIQDGEFTFMDGDGTPPPSIAGADGCDFATWNTDGTFIVSCGATPARTGTYLEVDPESGEVSTLWEDTEWDPASALPESLTHDHALDRVRSWRSALANSLPLEPPVILADGVEVADLTEGFGEVPKSYGIVFGIQNPE